MVGVIIISSILVLLAISGFFLAYTVVFPRRFRVKETLGIEIENGKFDWNEYSAWEKEEVICQSKFGYPLYCLYFPIEDSKHCVILSHGITYSRYGSVKYMQLFRSLGFNTLIYDLRHHGDSGGSNTTFGFYEKEDLKTIVDWVQRKLGTDSIIGTHGESMGAAISLQHAAIDPRISFVIEDCSYSELNGILEYHLKKDYHLPRLPFLFLASAASKLITGMSFNQVSPLRDIKNINVPVMFIHGAKDTYIQPSMTQEMFDQKINGARGIYLAENAEHAESFWSNPQEYKRVVTQFLKENQII